MKIMRRLLILLIIPICSLGQNTFLKRNVDTKWKDGTNELSFLETIDNKENVYRGVSSNSFIFFIDLDEDVYSIEDLNSERLLNCCMCSYTAIIVNNKDTLKIEKGSRDDFGNSHVIINTFYIQEKKLVQVEAINNNIPKITYWYRMSNEDKNNKL